MRHSAFVFILALAGIAGPSGTSLSSAPLSAVISAVEDLVNTTIAEASFDGVADEGSTGAIRLQTFTGQLENGGAFPDRDPELEQSLLLASRLSHLVQTVPADVGAILSNRAGCFAYESEADEIAYLTWYETTDPAFARIQVIIEGLRSTAAVLPPGVDGAPILRAAARLQDLREETQAPLHECISMVAERLSIEHNTTLPFEVEFFPKTTYPTGTVYALGFLSPRPATGRIAFQGDVLSAPLEIAWPPGGGFFEALTIRPDAPLGNHSIKVVGDDRVATANLTIYPAPSRVDVSYPSDLEFEKISNISITVRTVPGLQDRANESTVLIRGDLAADLVMGNGSATYSIGPFTENKTLRGMIEYPGTSQIEGDAVSYQIHVYKPRVSLAGTAPGKDYGGPLLVAGAALFVLATGIFFVRRRPRVRTTKASAEPIPSPTAHDIPRTFVAAFAALLARLVRWGQARPSMTAREIATVGALARFGPGPLLTAYERERYGNQPENAEVATAGRTWIDRVVAWFKARGSP